MFCYCCYCYLHYITSQSIRKCNWCVEQAELMECSQETFVFLSTMFKTQWRDEIQHAYNSLKRNPLLNFLSLLSSILLASFKSWGVGCQLRVRKAAPLQILQDSLATPGGGLFVFFCFLFGLFITSGETGEKEPPQTPWYTSNYWVHAYYVHSAASWGLSWLLWKH